MRSQAVMWMYLVLKWLHVLAACVYVGGSFANGLAKTLGDRGRSGSAVTALRFVHRSNRLLLVPASFALLATGLALAWVRRTPLLEGWLLVGLLLFAVLSALLLWAVRLEDRMLAMAEAAADSGMPLPPEYTRLSPVYLAGGAAATVLMLLMVLLMVARQAIV